MKGTVHKPREQSSGVKKHFYFDINQSETFTISTELLKLYLLVLFLTIDNNISPHLSLRTVGD